MEHHGIVDKLYLASGGLDVSQAVPLGSISNAVWVGARIENGANLTYGWLDDASLELTFEGR